MVTRIDGAVSLQIYSVLDYWLNLADCEAGAAAIHCVVVAAERLRDTLIHELCHAMVWIEHKLIDGHGNLWKYWYARYYQCSL